MTWQPVSGHIPYLARVRVSRAAWCASGASRCKCHCYAANGCQPSLYARCSPQSNPRPPHAWKCMHTVLQQHLSLLSGCLLPPPRIFFDALSRVMRPLPSPVSVREYYYGAVEVSLAGVLAFASAVCPRPPPPAFPHASPCSDCSAVILSPANHPRFCPSIPLSIPPSLPPLSPFLSSQEVNAGVHIRLSFYS